MEVNFIIYSPIPYPKFFNSLGFRRSAKLRFLYDHMLAKWMIADEMSCWMPDCNTGFIILNIVGQKYIPWHQFILQDGIAFFECAFRNCVQSSSFFTGAFAILARVRVQIPIVGSLLNYFSKNGIHFSNQFTFCIDRIDFIFKWTI